MSFYTCLVKNSWSDIQSDKNFIYLHIINVIHLSSTCYCIVLKSTLFCSGDGNLFFSYLTSFFYIWFTLKQLPKKWLEVTKKFRALLVS